MIYQPKIVLKYAPSSSRPWDIVFSYSQGLKRMSCWWSNVRKCWTYGKAYADAPFDLMYGFRGKEHAVDLFSPFEMLRFWTPVKIEPPKKNGRSKWTAAGERYKKKEEDKRNNRPAYVTGLHYTAIQETDRILLPESVTIKDPKTGRNIDVLGPLRHCWCWERRARPYIPVWEKSKMPDRKWSPEENSRLLSVYMRPWTLHHADASRWNPLLKDLAYSHLNVELPKADETYRLQETRSKSYATSWDWYISGNVGSFINSVRSNTWIPIKSQ